MWGKEICGEADACIRTCFSTELTAASTGWEKGNSAVTADTKVKIDSDGAAQL